MADMLTVSRHILQELLRRKVMDINSAKAFMKDYFEKLYNKLSTEMPIALQMCDLPEDMLADGSDPDEEWNTWKLIPSTVTDEDIAKYEAQYGLKFPNCIRAFLQTYHHCFVIIGRNMSDNPFYELDNAFNPHLVSNSFLPFSWDPDGYFIRCIDLSASTDEDKCPVVQFPHEELFDLQYEYEDKGEEVPRERISELAQHVAANFYEYLNGIFENIPAVGMDED